MHEYYDKLIQTLAELKYNILVAGFFGGVVYVTFTRNLTRVQVLTSILIGLVVAYYLTPLTVAYTTKITSLSFTNEMEGGVGFLLGMSALYIIPAIIRKLNKVGQ